MKRYDAWSESDPQCSYGGARCELYERTMGQYVTFDDHERAVTTLTAERDAAIDEKLFWVDKYAYEMEKSDRRCDQWERCFRLAFGLKNRYYSNIRALTAERDELQRRLVEVVKMLEPDGEHRPNQDSSVYNKGIWNLRVNLHARAVAIAIAEGRTE